tara:strand:+ start:1946 stop:2122 length:177 start_codon:yes stop_codon:yes gene_type:complete
MNNIVEFIDMQGYGTYVWPSYIVTALVLIVLLIISQRLLKANLKTKDSLENRDKKGLE